MNPAIPPLPGAGAAPFDLETVCPPEVIPDLSKLVIEDDKPVDNIFTEKQHRLLTEPLYSSWDGGGEPFLALANMGLFAGVKQVPLCPNVMVNRRVEAGADLSVRENRSYFVWIVGKFPEVVVEIVSDKTGGEEDRKMDAYARMGILYYIIFDPLNRLEHGVLRAFRLNDERDYEPIDPSWLQGLRLGLRIWEGPFEGHPNTWLRWCDQDGNVIPTGAERAQKEKERAEKEKERAEKEARAKDEALRKLERLAQQLRDLGVDPAEGP
jgi:hypothetical protein